MNWYDDDECDAGPIRVWTTVHPTGAAKCVASVTFWRLRLGLNKLLSVSTASILTSSPLASAWQSSSSNLKAAQQTPYQIAIAVKTVLCNKQPYQTDRFPTPRHIRLLTCGCSLLLDVICHRLIHFQQQDGKRHVCLFREKRQG